MHCRANDNCIQLVSFFTTLLLLINTLCEITQSAAANQTPFLWRSRKTYLSTRGDIWSYDIRYWLPYKSGTPYHQKGSACCLNHFIVLCKNWEWLYGAWMHNTEEVWVHVHISNSHGWHIWQEPLNTFYVRQKIAALQSYWIHERR